MCKMAIGQPVIFLSSPEDMLVYFEREGKEGGKGGRGTSVWERNINASPAHPGWGPNRNPGVCPDQELSLRHSIQLRHTGQGRWPVIFKVQKYEGRWDLVLEELSSQEGAVCGGRGGGAFGTESDCYSVTGSTNLSQFQFPNLLNGRNNCTIQKKISSGRY